MMEQWFFNDKMSSSFNIFVTDFVFPLFGTNLQKDKVS